jgi:GUN4-like/DnaJ domain
MTLQPDTYYQVLELEIGASQDDIKQAYKDLAKVWHPDRFVDNRRLQQKAEEKLKQINTAYEFLKSYQPQVTQKKIEPKLEHPVVVFLNCERLKKLLELGKLKDADYETKRLLLELAGREKEGWLLLEDVKGFSPQALSAIDQLWIKHSNGRFGFSVQRRVWSKLSCNSSADTYMQTVNENKFGQAVGWRKGSTWLAPWDSFNYDDQSPHGSLPREYIFALSGWWSHCKGWTGYLLWRFDEIFLKP